MTGGPFLDWWQRVLLSLDCDDHARLRRLLMPAFKRQSILAMRPQFQQIADELIAGFSHRGEVELIGEFSEPYAARILCLLLGLPEEGRQQVAHWADDLGRSLGIAVARDLPVIEAALEGLTGYIEAAVDDRIARPREDLLSTLVQAQAEDGRLTRDELVVGHCLGHVDACVDMAVALPTLARAMPDAFPDGPGKWLPVSGNTGALTFPIRFSPGR